MVAGVGIKEKEWKCRKAKWITSWLVKMASKSPACIRQWWRRLLAGHVARCCNCRGRQQSVPSTFFVQRVWLDCVDPERLVAMLLEIRYVS